ncbi:MAG: hypothetical protein WD512_19795 [Candidatus Paceibacterota bacterium]
MVKGKGSGSSSSTKSSTTSSPPKATLGGKNGGNPNSFSGRPNLGYGNPFGNLPK